MNYWLMADTHFDHEGVKEWCERPDNFAELILDNLKKTIKPDDVVIHLGDVSWKNDDYWHRQLLLMCFGCRVYLIRGNHDKHTLSWYLKRGWSCVCDQMRLNIYGADILFSHKPVADCGYDLNIHGHFHNSDHRRHEPELVAIKNEKQVLIKCEHEYKPVNLRKLVGKEMSKR